MSSEDEQRLTGMVKWFNNKSGFGFVTVSGTGEYAGKDIFAHYSSIRVTNSQYKYLVQGEYVDFHIVKSESDTHEYQYNKKSIEKYSNSLNIMHFYDKSFSAERMMSHLCTYVKTDYLSALMDDDIILTKSLYECICYLNNNPDYSAVHGKSFLMEVDACSNQPYGSSASLIEVDEMAVSEGKSSESRIADFFIKVRIEICLFI